MNPATTQKPGATSRVQTSALTLEQLVDAYMRAYAGRDRTRLGTLSTWRRLLGSRPAFEISDDDIFRGLERLRAEPARFYSGRDLEGKRILRKKGPRCAATVNRY